MHELLDNFSCHRDVSVHACGEAKILEVNKENFRIKVTIPLDVLEWFVEVVDSDAIVSQDWWDYEGYDNSPQEKLAEEMVIDVREFVTRLLSRKLRLTTFTPEPGIVAKFFARVLRREVRLPPAKRKLEWQNDGTWMQAIPFEDIDWVDAERQQLAHDGADAD